MNYIREVKGLGLVRYGSARCGRALRGIVAACGKSSSQGFQRGTEFTVRERRAIRSPWAMIVRLGAVHRFVVQRNPGEAVSAPGIRAAPGWAQPWDLRKTGPGLRPRFGFDSNGNWVTMAILIGKLKICPPSHPVLRKPSH